MTRLVRYETTLDVVTAAGTVSMDGYSKQCFLAEVCDGTQGSQEEGAACTAVGLARSRQEQRLDAAYRWQRHTSACRRA